MTDVSPIHGLRYDPRVVGNWGAVLGPPYDVISPAALDTLLERSPYQVTRIETAAGEAGAREAARLLQVWRAAGVLQRESAPAYYIDHHAFTHAGGTQARVSLYGAVRLTPWADGQVLPHEWTMSGPKVERQRLRRRARADVSPVMTLAPDRSGALAAALEEALALPAVADGLDANGERHTLRVAADAALVARIRRALADDTLYIADGHHRYESALADRNDRAAEARAAGAPWSGEEPENFVLTGIVRASDPGLIVGPTHRLVHVAPPADALERIAAVFDVTDLGPLAPDPGPILAAMAASPALAIGAAGLVPGRQHLLRVTTQTAASVPASLPASWADLDTALLQFLVLAPVFGIGEEALRAGQAVTYDHDAGTAYAATRAGTAAVTFLLNAPTLDQIFAAADAGDRMPQKSTYFTPKLPTGVVIYAFDA